MCCLYLRERTVDTAARYWYTHRACLSRQRPVTVYQMPDRADWPCPVSGQELTDISVPEAALVMVRIDFESTAFRHASDVC